jgi:outer membrane receptor protein involved in Fe transport
MRSPELSRSHIRKPVRTGILGACVILGALVSVAAAQQTVAIQGSVKDSTGAAIVGAQIHLRSAHSSSTTTTGAEGLFSFSGVADNSGSLQVSAAGFTTVTQAWTATSPMLQVAVVLQPGGVSERVVVSATRTEMKFSEVPGSPIQLSREDIEANPALTMDDLLRQVPGFSLFRRSSSRVSNPTTQGVSLRGVGASGPSRALVLEDGVPLVDPFGGWVYWDRVPRAELASVEVMRGGVSSLYGSNAIGGAVQFLTRVPRSPSMTLDLSYGNENSPDLSAWTGSAWNKWDFGAGIDMSLTDGYIPVPSFQRGAIDAEANSRHATVDGTIGHQVGANGRLFLRGSFFDEQRNNGTRLTTNSTGTGSGVAGVNTGIGEHDWISARVYGQVQGYDQTFSSIGDNRASETLVNNQHVPSQQLGTGVQWNHGLGSHTLIFGLDANEVMGASDEQLFSSTTGNQFATNIAGGRQRTVGIFGQDVFRFRNKWTVIAGLRWDDWANLNGSTVRIPVPASTATGTQFADRSDTSFSPRVSVLRTLNANVSVTFSGYRAFRAPTLNELYRTFRLGQVTTQSNALLRAERLSGAETGVRVTGFGGKFETRATAFWSDVVDPIVNVTLDPVTRQRQNLGRTRSVGTELDGYFRLRDTIQLSAGYQYVHAAVVDSVPTLVGLNVPEVPRHQFSWEARYWKPRKLVLSVQGRFSGLQYDDDLNTLPLKRYYVMELFVGREVHRGVLFYVAAENLLNQRYVVTLQPPASNPLQNLGPPILARAGVRLNFPASQ